MSQSPNQQLERTVTRARVRPASAAAPFCAHGAHDTSARGRSTAALCDKSSEPFDFGIDALNLRIYGRPMKRDEMSVEEQAARLSHRDRARLALRLIESLEPGQDEDVDALWLDEAEQRLRKYDEGGTQARDADEAIADIERQLT